MAETELMACRLIAHFGQGYWRGKVARKVYAIMNMENQAKLVQRSWRGYRVRLQYWKDLKSITSIQCRWRCKLARKVTRELRREARSIRAIAAERDRFKEESARLRKEVETLRVAREESESGINSSAELDRLRQEVQRLQNAITMSQGSIAEDCDVRSFNGYAGHSRFRNPSSYDYNGSYISPSLPGSIYAPYHSPLMGNTPDMMTSSTHSTGFGSVVSSPRTSLLDTDPQQDRVDYQTVNISDSSTTSRIFQTSVPGPICRGDDDKGDEHQHRFNTELRNEEANLLTSDSSENMKLHNSIREHEIKLMIEILRRSDDPLVLVNAPNPDGRTALHLAVETNNLDAIRELLKRSAVANAQDYYGNTPLHLSSGTDVVKLLLEEGKANPNIPNIDGICALHNTVERLDVESVRLLLEHNVKVDVADNISWFTPLHLTLLPYKQVDDLDTEVHEGSRAMIVSLLCGDHLQFNMNEKDREGNTALHYCAQLETPDASEIMTLILQKGADPKISNVRNQQALLLLCHNEDLRHNYKAFQQCLHNLLYFGADPNHQSNTGCTPLHLCLYHQDVDSAIQLISRSAELHVLWNRPKSWIPEGDQIGSSSVLALEMVSEDNTIHRLLAAINEPLKLAPIRRWCMHCKSPKGLSDRFFHCHHCGRHVCHHCARRTLTPEFFPKSFNIGKASKVCVVCEDILVARKEDLSNSSGMTNPASSFVSNSLHLT